MNLIKEKERIQSELTKLNMRGDKGPRRAQKVGELLEVDTDLRILTKMLSNRKASYTLEIINIANEFERLAGLPENAWDDSDYAKATACAEKLRRLEQTRDVPYVYDASWLVDDPDFDDALRARR